MTSIAQISENEQSEITGTVKLPFSQFFEQLVCRMIPDAKTTEKIQELDKRLLGSPALALNQCRQVLGHMAGLSIHAFRYSTACVLNYDKVIADHAVNILESAEEIASKNVAFSEDAVAEYRTICAAVTEILNLSFSAFSEEDIEAARKTEPLEEVIDTLKEDLRTRHFLRLQRGECSVAEGFVWSDILTNLERVSDHCSNISGCVLDSAGNTMNIHENQRALKNSDEEYKQEYNFFQHKYRLTI